MMRAGKHRAKRDRRRQAIRLRDGDLCWRCGNPLGQRKATIDHVLPVSLGGSNDLRNLRLAHSSCNGRAGNSLDAIPPEVILPLLARQLRRTLAAALTQQI